jgi:hypothetical protein
VSMFQKSVLFASALLLASLPSVASEETNPVAPSAPPVAIVKCPGVTSIPYTADAEQSLPMQIVGSLACGSTVAILSDSEGYTTYIRTEDGQTGFVARMYLSRDASASTPSSRPQPTVANPVNGVVRWQAGAPGCHEFLSHGRHVESITTDGITVQVSLQDTGWKFRANVAVSNQSGTAAEVQPGIVSLDELKPHLRTLPASSPKQLAHTANHQVLWTAATAEPPAVVSRPQLVHRSQADNPAAEPAATPDYLDPHMALTSDRPGVFERTETVDIESIALKHVSLVSGQKTAGVMWFDRDPAAHVVSMRIPLGDIVFDFTFAFDQK